MRTGPRLWSVARHLRLGCLYTAQMIKTRLEYRGDFIVECMASLASQAAGLLVVGVIFNSIPDLRGWTRSEVFFIYGFAITAQALFESFADAFYLFANRYVMAGEFDRVLLRPVHPLWQILVENISLDFLPDLVLGITILVVSALGLQSRPGLVDAVLLAGMLPCAVLVLSGVFLALASFSFWIEDRVGLLPPVYNLLEFGRYPITIYHPALRVFLSWVLPYGFVAFYPTTGFLGRHEFRWFCALTPLAGIVTFALGYAIFRAGMRHYRSTGS